MTRPDGPGDRPAGDRGSGLDLLGICLAFPQRDGGELPVLDDVSLRVAPGEFVSVVGASGCGKTTLLRIANGLARPDRGEVRVGGQPLRGPSPKQAFVFQEDLLLPWRSVLANVLFPLELRHTAGGEARERAARLLRTVGLAGFERSYPHELSVGMRQRVNLARALVVEPGEKGLAQAFTRVFRLRCERAEVLPREVIEQDLIRVQDERGEMLVGDDESVCRQHASFHEPLRGKGALGADGRPLPRDRRADHGLVSSERRFDLASTAWRLWVGDEGAAELV